METMPQFAERYRNALLEDTLAFWLRHGVDHAHGGYVTAVGRDGAVLDTDKAMWFQGRFAWLLSTLFLECEPREQWLAAAHRGVEFLRKYGFDHDGRMFFTVTRDGQPLRKRRYVFSEMFAIAALAAYGDAAEDHCCRREALNLWHFVEELVRKPDELAPKVNPETRPCKGLAMPMITLATAQILRRHCDDAVLRDTLTGKINTLIDEIATDFLRPEFQAVLETVGPNGEFLDHYDGRLINPGHAIEASWFILDEAVYQGMRPDFVELGVRILEWSWQWGWDPDHGGILYFRDVRGLPVQEYWHDMKFWWPQCEAIIATLYAYRLTGDERHWERFHGIHEWSLEHFPDPAFGEWFGYLHRDGRRSSDAKGTMWKGPFHLPRMQWRVYQLASGIFPAHDKRISGDEM